MYSAGDAVAKIDGYIICVTRRRRVRRREAAGADRGGRAHRGDRARWSTCPPRPPDGDGSDDDGDDARIDASAPWPQRRAAPFRAKAESAASASTSGVDHVRDHQDRRQAVPRRAGSDPARRAAARRRGRHRRAGRRCCTSTATTCVDGDDAVEGHGRRRKIVAHERGPKLRIVKFKPKRGYKRRNGHRQELTRIEITSIKLAGRRSRSTQLARQAADRRTEEARTDGA